MIQSIAGCFCLIVVFLNTVIAVICSGNSDYLMDIYEIFMHDTITTSIYIHCKAIFILLTIIIILIRMSNIFINCIVIAFNARDCCSNSYYKFAYYWYSFNKYISMNIISLELIICVII